MATKKNQGRALGSVIEMVRGLREAGMSQEQAEAVAHAIESERDIASQADLARLASEQDRELLAIELRMLRWLVPTVISIVAALAAYLALVLQ